MLFTINTSGSEVLTEVSRESQDLLPDKHVESVYRSIAEELVPVDLVVRFGGNTEVFTGLGDIYLVAFH